MLDHKIGQFLFELPDRPLTREEKVRLIKQALQSREEEVTQERLDEVMSRLLEEIQRFD